MNGFSPVLTLLFASAEQRDVIEGRGREPFRQTLPGEVPGLDVPD